MSVNQESAEMMVEGVGVTGVLQAVSASREFA
jgi:hypothetical protein